MALGSPSAGVLCVFHKTGSASLPVDTGAWQDAWIRCSLVPETCYIQERIQSQPGGLCSREGEAQLFWNYETSCTKGETAPRSQCDRAVSSDTYPWMAAFGGAVRSKHTKLHGGHLGLPGAKRSISTRPPKNLAKKISDGRTS